MIIGVVTDVKMLMHRLRVWQLGLGFIYISIINLLRHRQPKVLPKFQIFSGVLLRPEKDFVLFSNPYQRLPISVWERRIEKLKRTFDKSFYNALAL